MTGSSIRLRLRVVGAVVIMAIIGATGLTVEMQRRASIDAFRTATLNLGRGMAQQTSQPLASIDRTLQEIQTLLASSEVMAPDGSTSAIALKSAVDLLADRRKQLAGIVSLSVVDALGKTTDGTDLSGRDYFRHLSKEQDNTLFVGRVVTAAAGDASAIPMARRLTDAQGRFAGIVVADLSVNDLKAFYQLAMPPRRSVYVLRQDGVILLRYPEREQEIGKKIPIASPWYSTVAQGGGTYYADDYFGSRPIIAAVQPLRGLPFVVEASVAEADVLSEWHRQRVWVMLAGMSAGIGAVVLLQVFARQYRRVELSEGSLAAKNAELDTAHRQLDVTLANLSQGVCFYGNDLKLLVYNRRYCELYDLPEEAVKLGISLAEISALRLEAGSAFYDTIEASTAAMDAIVRAGKPTDNVRELANGRIISCHIEPLPGRGWVITHEDITERREAESKISFLARHDVLTGLANRGLFHERLEEALQFAERGAGFALLCLDLDRFKAVNDTLGHPVGDALLCAVAGRLRDAVREGDTVARLGGDEFAILLLNVMEVVDITIVARRLVETIARPFHLSGHKVGIGTSIGIVMAPSDSLDPVELMKDADIALYRAKQEGRETWRFFEPAMDVIARNQRGFETDLRQALQLQQMELHYQPLISVHDPALVGFEALLRWRHPSRGLLAPGEFLSVAEGIGLIVDIGAWVLQQACAEAVTWPDHLRVAVNLSTKQFGGDTLLDAVADALQTFCMAPERLELEITEALPLLEDKATLSALHDLHAVGTRIALDDFGAGASSLSYLRVFPFDAIKIDRSLIRDMLTSATTGAIIRGIIGLAENLHIGVIAEGVETTAQFEFLAEAGCNEIQGYLISRPVRAADIPALIDRLSGPDALSRGAAGGRQTTADLVR